MSVTLVQLYRIAYYVAMLALLVCTYIEMNANRQDFVDMYLYLSVFILYGIHMHLMSHFALIYVRCYHCKRKMHGELRHRDLKATQYRIDYTRYDPGNFDSYYECRCPYCYKRLDLKYRGMYCRYIPTEFERVLPDQWDTMSEREELNLKRNASQINKEHVSIMGMHRSKKHLYLCRDLSEHALFHVYEISFQTGQDPIFHELMNGSYNDFLEFNESLTF